MTTVPPAPPPKRIALIGYTSHYFGPFADALERSGFEVYWVHSLRSFTELLRERGTPASRIVDLSGQRLFEWNEEHALDELRSLERPDMPRINDLILMDRRLRTKTYGFALAYLAHAARALRALLNDERIPLIASGRDTALQLLSMLVARSCGKLWLGATYMRLPNERFMLTASQHTDEILPLGRVVSDADRETARAYLRSFREKVLRPYVRQSSHSWLSIVQRLPQHLADAWHLIRQSRHDAGNDFARYPLSAILAMYLRKKLNMLQGTFVKTYRQPRARPYVLFGLHRQPESSVDVLGAFFSDQTYLVRTIARSLPVGYDFLVKLHVSDADGWPRQFYRTLAAMPAVRLISPDADSRALLQRAALVVTNSGTMAYEAGLLGLPAITFSRVHFNALPTVHYCKSPVELSPLIDRLLRESKPSDVDAQIEDFLARMHAVSFDGMPNRAVFAAPLQSADLASLVAAYERSYELACMRALQGEDRGH